MHIDVVIPTYNRAHLLGRTLESLTLARVPSGLRTHVIVVDNNSEDGTRALVESFADRLPGRLTYVFEARSGKSNALNAGIAAAGGDVVGMIDDDEEVDAGWFEEIARAFADPDLDFITGPYVPQWSQKPPAWLPQRPSSVIGWVDGGATVRRFGRDYDGMLMGGNAVVRRALLRHVGGYDPALGPSLGGRLLSCEDEDMTNRLLAAGATGEYRPGLVIHHYIPAERMTKRYHRRWYFWHGVSAGVLGRTLPQSVPNLFGVPRYMIGTTVRNVLAFLPGLLGIGRLRDRGRRFDAIMVAIDTAGYWYGRHRFRHAASPAIAPTAETASNV